MSQENQEKISTRQSRLNRRVAVIKKIEEEQASNEDNSESSNNNTDN